MKLTVYMAVQRKNALFTHTDNDVLVNCCKLVKSYIVTGSTLPKRVQRGLSWQFGLKARLLSSSFLGHKLDFVGCKR